MTTHIATSREWLIEQVNESLTGYVKELHDIYANNMEPNTCMKRLRAIAAALVDDLIVRAGESTDAVVGDVPFVRGPVDAEATAWANAGRHEDWELIVDDMGSGDGNGVRRLSVPGGWIYQVAIWDLSVERTGETKSAKATHSHHWSAPVFVADPERQR
jgi:hypothetical protein